MSGYMMHKSVTAAKSNLGGDADNKSNATRITLDLKKEGELLS